MQNLTQMQYNGFELDDLGECSVLSQSSKMVPDKLGQKEVRQVHIRIACFQQDFETNMNLIQQARAALQEQNKEFIWTTPATTLSDSTVVPGVVVLDRPVTVSSHDIPEDPNSWGSYKQQINIVLEFEVDLTDPLVHLAAFFQQTGAAGGPLSLGMVYSFKPSYRSTKYSELRNIRERAAGALVMSGEIFIGLSDTNGATDTRRAQLQAAIATLTSQINGRDGLLTYGLGAVPGTPSFFNQIVRVQSFDADVNQAVNGITYSLTADWTAFPNEANYCAADIRVDRQEDREAGEKFIRLQGRIGAPNPTIANAKLSVLMQSVLTNAASCDGDQAWIGLAPRTFTTNPRYVNSDDTQTLPNGTAQSATNPMGSTANGLSTSTSVFIEVEFNIEWRKKSAQLLTWKLNINTQDDASTGMQHISYTGSVIASGATADLAYAAAAAQAAVLGDNKYAFRMASKVARSDRYIDAGTSVISDPIIGMSSSVGYKGAGLQEFVECTFSYEYRAQGARIYMEVTADTTTPTFGENGIRVSGFVVGPDYNTAKAAYVANVRNLYTSMLILDEDTSQSTDIIQGTAIAPLAASGVSSLFVRLNFSLTIWTPKPTGTFAIQYKMTVTLDYVRLLRNTDLKGNYFGSQPAINAAMNRLSGNALDTFFATLSLGVHLSDMRAVNHDYLGTNNDNLMALEFADNFTAVLPVTGNMSQILQCEMQEELSYSGTRWSEFRTPDGPSVIQNTGVECGTRSVSGTVTAATEAAARAYIKNQIVTGSGAFLNQFPGSTPTVRYIRPPKISSKFVFIPLTSGVARGASENLQLVELAFSFSELLPSYAYA